MGTIELVRPLEGAWHGSIDEVLRALRAPTLSETGKLGPKLVELSRAYNTGSFGNVPLEARVAFSFARDVPKGAAAVRELVATGLLALPAGRPLRIVDLGAGLGAMTWGIARALEAAGQRGAIEALFLDADGDALEAALALGRAAPKGSVSISARTRRDRLAPGMTLPRADLVVMGQVLSELDTDLASAARALRHATLVREVLANGVEPNGALVIVEPALRERTRHLHAVRDVLAGETTIFAPCLHPKGCPALALDKEWCHEDLAIDLPPWLVPLARAAGLRWQGLTFSHLVLRRDGETMASRAEQLGLRVRLISDLLRTKGKIEVWGCTEHGARTKLRRLDREAREGEWDAVRRGDLATIVGNVDETGRLSREARVDVWPMKNYAEL